MSTNGFRANVWEAVYRPFGEVHAITGTVTRILRFPGQYFLFETGRSHNWHRTYDATIGRYLQADPLGFIGGSANYTYVSNSPITYVDPDVAPSFYPAVSSFRRLVKRYPLPGQPITSGSQVPGSDPVRNRSESSARARSMAPDLGAMTKIRWDREVRTGRAARPDGP